MKIAKLFLKYTATVLLFMLISRGNASAQVTYNSKNTATVTAVAPGNVQVTDVSNAGTTIVRLNGDETPVIFPMIGLAKTVGTPVIQSNGTYNITYTLRVRNYSGIPLKNIQITDDLATTFPSPATFTMVGVVTKLTSNATNGSGAIAVNTSFNGTTDKNLLNPATSSLIGMPTPASGTAYYASISFTINVNVNGNYTTYNNTATTTATTDTPDPVNVTDVSHNNASPNNGDNTKTPLFYNTPTPVNLQTSDIRVIKTVDNLTPKEGDNVVFEIKVRNLGAGDAAPVVVSDLLTSGFQYVSDDGAGAYVSATGTWSVGILTVGAANEKTLKITAKVLPNRPIGDYVNTASSSHPQDPVTPNNTSTVTLTPVPSADLKITNTDGKTQYVPGTTNTYTMVVTNDGPSNVTGATVANTLPAGVTGTWIAVYTGGATGTANGTNSISESVNMPSGSTITYTYVVNVPSGTTGNFVNTATVAVPAGVTDPTPANNTATDTDTQNSTADLKITNTDGKTQYVPGTSNTYTVVVTNDGPSNVTGATVANTLPAGVTGTWTAVYAGGATGTANGTNSISESVNMPSGSTITYTYVVNVPSGTTGNFVNTATVTAPAGVTDPTPANNTATDTDTQNSVVDLKITNTDGKTQYIPGTTNTYTMVVTNDGPSNVTGATVANTLPAGVTGAWTVVYTGGATGTANGTGSISELVDMPSGATATYTYIVSVPSSYTGSFVNTGTVTAPAGVTDPTPANNTATDTDTQNSTADLKITNTDGKTQYVPGTTNTYTMVVTNDGPSNVTGATIANTLPAGVTGTWTVVYAGGATGNASGTGSISELVDMPSGATATYTYIVSVPSSYTGNFVNTGTVTAPAGVTDPTPANNTATDTDTQNSTADLKITNTDGKTEYIPGTSNTYTMVVTNDGPSNVLGATIANTLPAGVTGTWTAVYAGGATGTANGTNSISQLVDMPSGSTITYTYVVDVPSGTTGNFINTATVTAPAGVTDPTPANNTATDTDTQNSIADLKITNTDGKTQYIPGTTNTYTIVVTNDGPSNAPGSTVTNTLPAGITGTWTAVYTGGATGNASGTNSISETVDMPAGATITYTYIVTIPSGYTGNFVNTATVATPVGITDPTPANNTATDTDTQNSEVDLKITKTNTGGGKYTPGTNVVYTVTASNAGRSDAIGALVEDTMPTGTTGSWTAVYSAGASGTAASGTGNISQTVTIPKGGTITYTVTVVVPSGRTGNLYNQATITKPVGSTEVGTDPNQADVTDTQDSKADLKITNTDGQTQYIPGTSNTYTIVVTNDGPSNAPGSTVTNTLPAGVTGTWTAVYTGGATGNASGTNSISETVDMPTGSTITYTYIVSIPSSYTGNFVNTATVATPVGITDPTPANNTAVDTDTQNSEVDLKVTKTNTLGGKYIPGTNVVYTVTATNAGRSDAIGALVEDTMPTGTTGSWTAVYSAGASGTAASGTGNISQTVTIPRGGTITYTVTVVVPSGRTGNLYNQATITKPVGSNEVGTDPNQADITDIQDSEVDLKITKTNTLAGKYIPGTNVVYTVTATNAGRSDAIGALVEDAMPTGTTGSWTAVYSAGASGVAASGTGNISQLVTIPKGGTITYTVTVVVPSGRTGNLYNKATITKPVGTNEVGTDPNEADVTDIQDSEVDLKITKTNTGGGKYIPGTNVVYTVTATNAGRSDAIGALVEDTMPTGTTGSWTAVYSAGASGTAASGTGNISQLVTIPKGGTITYTVTVVVPSGRTGNLYNKATITKPVGSNEVGTDPNEADVTDIQDSEVDLKITKTNTLAGKYIPGTNVVYTVTATNAGRSDAIGALVEDTMPTGTTGSWTAVYSVGASGAAASGTGNISQLVTIPKGGTITYTITVVVPSGRTGNLYNKATITKPVGSNEVGTDPNEADVTDIQDSEVDLKITKTNTGGGKYTPGTNVVYTVTATNAGRSDAIGALVEDVMPTGTTGSWTAVYSAGASGVAASGTGNISQLVTIPKGGTITYTVTVVVPSGRTGNLYNKATITKPVGSNEVGTDPNEADVTDTQNSITDLKVTKTISSLTPEAGSSVTFKITVVNGGPSDASGVKVADLLKSGYTFLSAVPSVGTYNAITGVWTIGNLIYNQTVDLTVVARVVPDATAGNYVNTAVVSGNETDPVLTNNTATVNPTPIQVIDLAITKAINNTTPDVGSEVTFTIKVRNNGPSRATNVVVNDLLKAGYTFVAATPSIGSYNAATGVWQIVSLAANDDVTITIKAKVNPDLAPSAYVNTATVTADQVEHITNNNTATVSPVPVPIADLQIAKTASSNTPSINTNVVFTLTATNNGPSSATGVSVSDLLKAGYTFVNATASTGTYNNATGIWTIGNLASGASATLKVTALVKATGPYDNTATITGTEKDPIPANNTVTITPVPQATPSAVNDEVKICGGGNATIIDVLANDQKSIADLDPTSVVITKQPTNGSVTVNTVTGKVTYIPNAGYLGNDDFSYTVKDKNGGTSNVANVKISINQPIIAVNDNATTNPNTAVTLDILGNDIKGTSDIVPGSVIITQQPTNGTLTVDPSTGKATYTPNAGFFGTDSFKYTVKDANGCVSNVATAEIKLNDLPKIGLAKSVMAVQKQQNGSYNIIYHFVVGNYGTAVLNNVSIKDDLRQTFKGDVFNVKSITSLGTLKVNTQYNGSSNTEMLLAGNTLAVGEVQHIEMVVNITLSSDKGTYNNSATAEGTSPSGLKSTDVSTDGLKPDPTIPGDVTPSVPTPVDLNKPVEFIPEGFSPNQDGTNDTFVIRNTGNKRISLEIYNRWANRVYRSADYKNDWAGQSNEGVRIGSDLPEGTYFYIIIIDGKDKYVGSITLKR